MLLQGRTDMRHLTVRAGARSQWTLLRGFMLCVPDAVLARHMFGGTRHPTQPRLAADDGTMWGVGFRV